MILSVCFSLRDRPQDPQVEKYFERLAGNVLESRRAQVSAHILCMKNVFSAPFGEGVRWVGLNRGNP